MNPHYDRYLTQKYAPLYRDRYAPMNQTCMCWGFDVGDGWFNIINTLSSHLCSNWLSAKRDYDTIKDGIGRTRYDMMFENADAPVSDTNFIITQQHIDNLFDKMKAAELLVPVAVQVKEKFGGLRFYVNGASAEHDAKIEFAESMSYRTCEVCGRPGKPTRDGWIRTLCKEHRKQYND